MTARPYSFLRLRAAVSPGARVEPMGKTFKVRVVFAAADYRVLFPLGGLVEVWGQQCKELFFLVLAGTGIRSGEARALTRRQVLWEERALLIHQTFVGGSLQIGPISEKKGGSKIVLLPSRVHDELKTWQRLSLWKEAADMIFPGKGRGIPVSAATITHALPATIARLNAEAKRKELPPAIEMKGRNLVVLASGTRMFLVCVGSYPRAFCAVLPAITQRR